MKMFAKIMLMGALVAAPLVSMAQDENGKTDEQLSIEYKHRIEMLKAEIKANKAKQKLNPSDAAVIAEGNTKKAELAEVQSKKKVVDSSIKAKKASEKAAKKAEKAKEKAEKAAKKAQKAAEKAATAR